MIDLALVSLIIANNPGIEINLKFTPDDYCRRYPQDYTCSSGRGRRFKKDCCKDSKNMYNTKRLVFTEKK